MNANLQKAALASVFGILITAAPSETAWPACFEDVGCTNNQYMSESQLRQLSCQNLWTVRNTIYYENKYCFETTEAQDQFSNQNCVYHDMAAVPLNTYERANVSERPLGRAAQGLLIRTDTETKLPGRELKQAKHAV
jgi:YARHG domain